MKKYAPHAIVAVLVLVILGGVYAIASHKAGPRAATPAERLQTYLDANKTDQVAAMQVVDPLCKSGGPATFGGVTYQKIYACPVVVNVKANAGGLCFGIVFALTDTDAVSLVAAPQQIDPRECGA